MSQPVRSTRLLAALAVAVALPAAVAEPAPSPATGRYEISFMQG